jgi:hypothetical protein
MAVWHTIAFPLNKPYPRQNPLVTLAAYFWAKLEKIGEDLDFSSRPYWPFLSSVDLFVLFGSTSNHKRGLVRLI